MRLETAVANWIRAEWVFRSSPEAYRGETQEWFEKACADLREALTGAGDLDIAAHTVGLPKKISQYAAAPVAVEIKIVYFSQFCCCIFRSI